MNNNNIDVEIELEREIETPDGDTDYELINVICNLDYQPAERGSRDSYGVQMEPDYDAAMIFNYAVRKDNGNEIELTKEEIEQAEQAAWDYEQARYEASQEYERD